VIVGKDSANERESDDNATTEDAKRGYNQSMLEDVRRRKHDK